MRQYHGGVRRRSLAPIFIAVSFVVAVAACERARDPEAKPLREKDGPRHGDELPTVLDTCRGAPTGGKIVEALTLPRGCVLHVATTLTIEAGAIVTIEPGVRLLFAKGAAFKIVDGIVEAKGEKGAEIVFDSDAATPAEKDWNGIELVKSTKTATATSTFDHVIIEHAGGGTKPASLLVHSAAQVSIGTCTVKNDGGAGIRLET
jgi:hypothetical protein